MDPTTAHLAAAATTMTPMSAPIGNITHPRRAAQNRAAQRTFRNRRKAYIKDMEQRVLELDQTHRRMEEVQAESREIWRRFRVLEELVSQHGLPLPNFPTLTLTSVSSSNAAGGSAGAGAGGRQSGSEVEDENRGGSLSSSTLRQQQQQRAQQQQQQQKSGDDEDDEDDEEDANNDRIQDLDIRHPL